MSGGSSGGAGRQERTGQKERSHPHGRGARRRGRRARQRVVRSHSDSSIPAKLSAWRREVLRVEQEFHLRGDDEGDRGGGGREEPKGKKRHRSADSVCALSSSGHLASSATGMLFSESDGKSSSRSSSPAPSSGVECNSIKDSPLQLDHDTMSDSGMSDHHHHQAHHNYHHGYPYPAVAANAASPHAGGGGHHMGLLAGEHQQGGGGGGGEQPRSVMSGGPVKGWLPDVAVVLWRRMLGALGNINHIADTVIHAMVYKYLVELFDILVRIRANQGVSVDNLSTPPSPEYVPPFTIFAPWCFRALNLPDTYQRGRLYALRYSNLYSYICPPYRPLHSATFFFRQAPLPADLPAARCSPSEDAPGAVLQGPS